MLLRLILCVFAAVTCAQGQSRTKRQPPKITTATLKTDVRIYKHTPQGDLRLHLFLPPDSRPTDRRAAIVFFFGGGWKNGQYTQFVPQAEYFASRGLVAASADYRVASVHKTTPAECVEDAKSAVRWLRDHAQEFGISKVIAAGGSAGGHLAAASAMVPGYDTATDAGCIPDALVLFNPALNLAEVRLPIKDASGRDIAAAILPTNFLSENSPPAILFFGSADELMPQGTEFVAKAHALGVRAELYLAPDMPHGFFNRAPWTQITARQADLFLTSLGYLTGQPTVAVPAGAPELQHAAAH